MENNIVHRKIGRYERVDYFRLMILCCTSYKIHVQKKVFKSKIIFLVDKCLKLVLKNFISKIF